MLFLAQEIQWYIAVYIFNDEVSWNEGYENQIDKTGGIGITNDSVYTF